MTSSNFLNDKPKEWKNFAWCHIVGIHKLWFSWKLFDLSSTGLEIAIVLSFFRKCSWILKKEEKHCSSENIEDFRKVQRQIYCKIVQVSLKPFSSKKYVIEFYTQLFKDLNPMQSFPRTSITTSIGSKSLFWPTKVGVKFYNLFLQSEWLQIRGGSSSKLKEGQPEKKAPKGR